MAPYEIDEISTCVYFRAKVRCRIQQRLGTHQTGNTTVAANGGVRMGGREIDAGLLWLDGMGRPRARSVFPPAWSLLRVTLT